MKALAGVLVHPFNVRQPPSLVHNRLFRAVHSKPRKPFLTGLGVKPVGFLTGGRLRAKVDVHSAVGVLAQFLVKRTERETRRVEKEARRCQTIAVADQNSRTGTSAGTCSR